MEAFLDILVKLLSAIATLILVPMLYSWLREKIGNERAAYISELIIKLVHAAEQIFTEPKSGEKKMEYVKARLLEEGVDTTDPSITAMIEAAVYDL